ncbi:MAG: arsenic resistance protein [Candidatus Methanoplasma sp.]|jgi:ACR3 family arsenite efflux pump ArsB|nr:arsenic resistance protein [Candidatus Methanoplasma sp.]
MDAGLGKITKMQPVFIICAAAAGIVLGQTEFFADNSGGLIEPFLMALLFVVFLKIDLRDIGRSLKNIRFSAASIVINFIWTPIFAVILGYMFLGGLDMRLGFLMLLVTPCTDWYLVFTGMSKGNVPLSTSILPTNLVLQVLLLPVYLFMYLGTGSSFEMSSILVSIVIVLVIPLAAANLIKYSAGIFGKAEPLSGILDRQGDNIQLVFLCLAVLVMFASQGNMITDNPTVFLHMLIPLGLFFVVNFILARIVGKALRFGFDDATSLTFTTLARNSPLALAIAVAAFPDSPLIALVLVVGPLIELPVLSLASAVILKMRLHSEDSAVSPP